MITIKINNIDRTSLIDWKSVVLKTALTSQIDTLEFIIKKYPGKDFKPEPLDDVSLLEDGTKLFGGKIVRIEESIEGMLEKVYVLVKDHTHEMDSKLVVKVYDNFGTAEDIINDIKDNFLPAGFTTNNVKAPVNVNYIRFNYEQPSKCFQQLAELIGYDWYVDENKDIHFFSKEENTAPFNLTDTNGKYIWNSLVIKKDVKNLRNTIYVRGGTFQGSLFEEIQVADGQAKVFTQGFRYSNIKVYKDSGSGFTQLSVGIDNITDPNTVDVLYNFNEKSIKFRDNNKPANGDKIKVEGNPHIPVIIKIKDNNSITQFGEYEHKIVDKSINSKEGARDRAKGEILQWADTIEEATFETREKGLRVGQQINIQSAKRGINQNFIITRITSKLRTPNDLIHKVSLVTTEVFGSIEFLQKLLIQKDKEIKILENEVLDKIEAAYEKMSFQETVQVSTDHNRQIETMAIDETFTVAKNAGTEFVYAPFTPSGNKRAGAYDGAVYS